MGDKLNRFPLSSVLRVGSRHRLARVLLVFLFAASGLGFTLQGAASVARADTPGDRERSPTDRDFLGMVMRDPFYEYNPEKVNFKDQPNKPALEEQARDFSDGGVRWVRMEFFADYAGSVPAG